MKTLTTLPKDLDKIVLQYLVFDVLDYFGRSGILRAGKKVRTYRLSNEKMSVDVERIRMKNEYKMRTCARNIMYNIRRNIDPYWEPIISYNDEFGEILFHHGILSLYGMPYIFNVIDNHPGDKTIASFIDKIESLLVFLSGRLFTGEEKTFLAFALKHPKILFMKLLNQLFMRVSPTEFEYLIKYFISEDIWYSPPKDIIYILNIMLYNTEMSARSFYENYSNDFKMVEFVLEHFDTHEIDMSGEDELEIVRLFHSYGLATDICEEFKDQLGIEYSDDSDF